MSCVELVLGRGILSRPMALRTGRVLVLGIKSDGPLSSRPCAAPAVKAMLGVDWFAH